MRNGLGGKKFFCGFQFYALQCYGWTSIIFIFFIFTFFLLLFLLGIQLIMIMAIQKDLYLEWRKRCLFLFLFFFSSLWKQTILHGSGCTVIFFLLLFSYTTWCCLLNPISKEQKLQKPHKKEGVLLNSLLLGRDCVYVEGLKADVGMS